MESLRGDDSQADANETESTHEQLEDELWNLEIRLAIQGPAVDSARERFLQFEQSYLETRQRAEKIRRILGKDSPESGSSSS